MAGLFATGKELQQQRMDELASGNRSRAMQGGGTSREKSNAALGSDIVSGLVGAFSTQGESDAAGDVRATLGADVDIQTSEGMIQYQRALFDGGFDKEAIVLNKPIKERLDIEKAMRAENGGKGKDGIKAPKFTAPNRFEVDATRDLLMGHDSDMGANIRDMVGSEDPMKLSRVNSVINKIAVSSKNIEERVRNAYENLPEARKEAVGLPSSAQIKNALVKQLADSDVTTNEAWFFGTDGAVDLLKQDELLKGFEDELLSFYKETLGSPAADKVETVPHQQSTENNGAEAFAIAKEEAIPEAQTVPEFEAGERADLMKDVEDTYDALKLVTSPRARKALQNRLAKLTKKISTIPSERKSLQNRLDKLDKGKPLSPRARKALQNRINNLPE